ncbi:MAG: SURF1 family protein [Candidatus Planktophila sp.]|nr:SURF1 family protein [Candidatus Planktophila sp.]
MQREPWALLKSAVALALIVLCLWAAQWQYQRGVDRHARNTLIKNHISLAAQPLSTVATSPARYEWQSVTTSGEFDSKEQILLRNRYSEGVYGFEVLTLFTSIEDKRFWVDRGWVKAGITATTVPEVRQTPSGVVEITGRLRLDSSLPRGSFFALPASGAGLVAELNAQSRLETEDFYLDLLTGSDPSLTPDVASQLPELSDGPHMAYALQWIFFAGLVIYGRILIRRTR